MELRCPTVKSTSSSDLNVCMQEKFEFFFNDLIDCVGVGLKTHQPLWVILCHLPEKGRKEIEEIVEEIRERGREERGIGIKEKKQKKSEHSPSTLTCYKDSRPCPTVNQYQLDALVTLDTQHLRHTQPALFSNDTSTLAGHDFRTAFEIFYFSRKQENFITYLSPAKFLEHTVTTLLFFFFLKENKNWHFIWMVYSADNSHKMF